MSNWIEAAEGHEVLLQDDGGVLWEHPTLPGYWNGNSDYPIMRHQVSPYPGAMWQVVQHEPLTLLPSLHCAPALGGCGMHGFIRDGRWEGI